MRLYAIGKDRVLYFPLCISLLDLYLSTINKTYKLKKLKTCGFYLRMY